MKRYVEVSAPGAQPRRYALSGDTVTLGAGRQAAICARYATSLADEHVELTPTGEGCRAKLCPGVESLLVYDGKASREHLVIWGQDIFVGHVRLSMIEAEPEKHGSLIATLLAVLGLPLALFALKDVGRVIEDADLAPVAPVLTEEVTLECGQSDPEMALHRAERAHLGARAKVARYPFEATDGIEALRLFSEARACYALGGRLAGAESAHAEQERWQARLEQDYQGHQLRLHIALENDAAPEALAEVGRLKALLVQVDLHPYAAWLSRVERRLKRRSGRSVQP